MSDDGLYHVVMHRKGLVGQVQLNFHTKTSAQEAFEKIATATVLMIGGGLQPALVLTDDFGSTMQVDRSDIGHLVLIDAGKVFDMRTRDALMQARAQARANRQASVDPVIGGRVVMPAANAMPS